MARALDVAKYYLDKDPERKYFDHELVERNGKSFYTGCAKINKFLHITQELYLAKYGKLLISDHFYAYDNGAVCEEVQKKFNSILYMPQTFGVRFKTELECFLDKIAYFLEEAELDDLISLSHEDEAWQEKCVYKKKQDQIMDFVKNRKIYKERFADALDYMENCE